MIVLYKGRRGAGKTLSMVKDGLKFKHLGYKILANFECFFAEYITNQEILELSKHSNIINCILMIDEVQMFFDSRRGMRKSSINFSNFIQEIRKRHVHILGCTQYSNNVDLRFRQHVDIICYPRFIKDLNVCENLYVDLTSIEDNVLSTFKARPAQVKLVFDAKPIFKLYNTEEIIMGADEKIDNISKEK